MEPIFLKKQNEVLYLITGDQEQLDTLRKEGYSVLDPGMSEGAGEKHIPLIEKTGQRIVVKVGSVFHPMTNEHSIGWVFLETEKGGQIVKLDPNSEPVAEFCVADGDTAVAAYAYCNLHGLWKMEIFK